MKQDQTPQEAHQKYMEGAIKKAYNKIKSTYEDKKGKGFILHLISAFLPIEHWNVDFGDTKRCAITNTLGLNIGEYIDLKMDYMFMGGKVVVGTESEKECAISKFNSKIEDFRKKYTIEEGEDVEQSRKMYFSETSDKVLCTAALVALRDFALNRMFSDDRAISVAMKTKQFSQVEGVTKKEANVVAMKSEGYALSEGNESVFAALREKFKS